MSTTKVKSESIPKSTIFILALIASVNPLAMGMYVPSMPSIAKEFEASYGDVQLGLSVFFAFTALSQLLIGPLSDRFGRKPILLISIIAFIIGTILTIMADGLTPMIIGRALQAVGAAGIVLSRTIVRDMVTPAKVASYIGFVTMGMAVAPMIGPAIGGAVDQLFGWRTSFSLLGIFGFLVFVLVFFKLEETNTDKGLSFRSQFKQYGALLKEPTYWAFIMVVSLNGCIFFAFLGGAPAIASNVLGMAPAVYGAYFGLVALGYAIGNFISGKISEARGINFMMAVGGVISLLGASAPFIFYSAGHLTAFLLFVPATLIGVGNGMVLPSAVAGGVSVRDDSVGAATGLMGSIQIACAAVASYIAGLVVGADGSVVAPFLYLLAIIGVISVFAIYIAIKINQRREEILQM